MSLTPFEMGGCIDGYGIIMYNIIHYMADIVSNLVVEW